MRPRRRQLVIRLLSPVAVLRTEYQNAVALTRGLRGYGTHQRIRHHPLFRVTEILLLLPVSRDRYRDGHVLITASPPTDSALCVEFFFWQPKQYVSNGCHCQVRSSAVDVDDDSVSATTGHRCLRSSWWL
jgi:hypothetical protein